jgi:hypothetical protein
MAGVLQQNDDEAPPCMRWRGLARFQRSPHRRSLDDRLRGTLSPARTLAPIPVTRYQRVPKLTPELSSCW